MNYTKGKLILGPKTKSRLYIAVSKNTLQIIGQIDKPDLASKIVHRYNCHDDLLAACEWARDLYDQLALGPLEAACKYGDNYEPPTDEGWLNMRTKLEEVIAKAKKD